MKIVLLSMTGLILTLFILSCGGDDEGGAELSSWDKVKASASVEVFLTSEYSTPEKLGISTLGWEDGINISRDGLHLYATYIPADFLSFVLSFDTVENLQYYDRGPHYDMSFDGSAIGASYPWYQSDIIYASRTAISDSFSEWNTSSMKRTLYSEGALTAVFNGNDIDICAFTSNDENGSLNNIKVITGVTGGDPSGTGTLITTIDTSGISRINTNYIEDNPHLERITSNDLVLFFDSEDRPGGEGSHDIWYSVSSDNGTNWSTPVNVSSINTSDKEHQPHLYHDGTDWWLYYSAYHTDLKLAIFRAKLGTPVNWNSWGSPEIVIGAGNTAGIGEPTLTADGDLYFVVVYENPEGTDHNRYDADAWAALKK